MYAEISAAVASAKTALDIAKAAHGLSNYNELVAAVSEVNAKLVDATVVTLASLEKQSTLASEVSDLKEKLRKIENWESQMQRYALFAFPTGALAYAFQQRGEKGEPLHYLCAACKTQRKKSILQPYAEGLLRCSFGHEDVQISHVSPSPSLPKWDDGTS